MERQNSEAETNTEYEYASKLKDLGYLPGPEKCGCGNTKFSLQIDNNYKTSKICYRCTNYKCKKGYNVRTNSFLEDFPQIRLIIVGGIIKSMLCLNFNLQDAFKDLNDSLKLNIGKATIRKVYKKIRYALYRYLYLYYRTELLADTNDHKKLLSTRAYLPMEKMECKSGLLVLLNF